MKRQGTHNSSRSRTPRRRSGFTLLECIFVVVILALTVPVSVMFLEQRTSERRDALQYTRANTLARSVLENVLADVSSKDSGLGYSKLASSSTYLDSPTTGLYARLDPMISMYGDMGIRCAVTIGSESAANGVVSGTAANNVFRTVTVTATFTNSMSEQVQVEVAAVVTDF